jgi:hypothetical protein
MDRFHQIIGKKLWFVLFNTVSMLYLVLSGRLHLNLDSILGCTIALLLINGIALISARNFPDWK